MARIPEEVIDEIRQRADITDVVGAYIPLKQRGRDAWGCCPFHKEKTPSFKVSSDHQAFKCFGCGKSGSVFTFIQDIENVDFIDAVRLLAQRTGVQIPESGGQDTSPEERDTRKTNRERGLALLADVARWFRQQLSAPPARLARLYLDSRGIDPPTADQFCIGYAPDSFDATIGWAMQQGYTIDDLLRTGLVTRREDQPDSAPYDRFRGRIMFAIHDELGKVVGFSGRVMDPDAKTAKYVNSPESEFFHKSRILYGFHLARQAFKESGCALVCEGQLDVIACHRAGLTHAVSAQGTAFTEDHVRRLQRSTKRVLLAFDADSAGRKAALRSIELCHAADLSVGVIPLPTGEDPDSVFRKAGAEGLRNLLDGAVEAIPFAFASARETIDAATPEGMASVVREVLSLVVPLPSPVTRVAHARWLAKAINLPEAPVLQTLDQMLRRQAMLATPAEHHGHQADGRPARGNEPPVFIAPPPLLAPSQEDKAICVLLELTLLSATAAGLVAQKVPHDLVGQTPVAEALNLVLAHVEEGEWREGVDELRRRDDLLANPDIGKILLSDHHQKLDPERTEEAGTARNTVRLRLEKAIADCVLHLRLRDLEQRLAANQQAQATEADPDYARNLQREH
ncbi:MAG: DNA primase, partial [Lentisphaeria bacterium]|nr:DNA primase [Lentisphaeria bacterium]